MRYYGFWRTVRALAGSVWHAAVELRPSRRKARFGDLDFDWENSVDTTRSNLSFRAQLLAEITGRPYFATEPWLFREMMSALPIRLQDFTFVDLGSGKGRALLMAAQYGFKRIIGVEHMPEWHRVAVENIRRFAATNPSAPPMESVCMDAQDFVFPAGALVVYLFNPFPEPVLAAVLDRLRASLLRDPRPLFIAYRFPEFDNLLQRCGWLEKISGTQQWTIYRNQHSDKST